MSTDGVLVGGEPLALLGASSAMHEVASRTDDIGVQLARALAQAASTIMAAAPFAPLRAPAVLQALYAMAASPGAGLATVFAAFEGTSLELRGAGQALEAAGAVGLLATGGLGLLRGERPTVLASADGVDLSRQAMSGSWSGGPVGQTSTTGVREVRRPDGSSFFVVEMTTVAKESGSVGVQVNGVGGFVEAAVGAETTMRWAVATKRDAELLIAQVSVSLVPVAGALLLSRLPKPTEVVVANSASVTGVGGIAAIPGTTASGNAVVRGEVTTLAAGGQRFAASISGGGQAGFLGVAGTGGTGSAKVAVERAPTGAVTKVSLSATTEVDRGRHGNPILESGNREATLVERQWEVELTPERRAAADRIATAVAGGHTPNQSDVRMLADAVRDSKAQVSTYEVRHQQQSADIALREIGVGGGGGIDTAELRQP